jgi:hypothetical protein
VITVSGVGFTPNDPVTVTYRHSIVVTSNSTTTTVRPDGSFSTTLAAGDALGGSHIVTARDAHGVSASTTFQQG